jgi:UDP-galactopyranose mutase
MFDYVIVGAGLAGSVMAEQITSVSDKKVLIIEKRNHIAGNCFDYKDENNILIHKYGPHLFHTSNQKVWDYLSKFTEWQIYHHKVLAFIDGQKVPVPFNLNTLYKLFPTSTAKKLEEKLLENFPFNSKIPILELKQSNDSDLIFLADFVYDKIFLNYTAKQWGMKPEDLDSAVTARVPVFIGKDDRYFNDTFQAIPKYGYTKLFENILDHKNIKIMLNTDSKEVLNIKNEKFYLFGNEFNGKIIFTGQIDEFFDYRFGELPYRSVEMKFETLENDYFQEAATVNYPNNYTFTRITEFKHIHPVTSSKTTILKEYPQQHIQNKTTPYYPIFTEENQLKYQQYKEYSKQFTNLLLLGRLAEYKYYDMDDIVERVLEVIEEIK